MVSIMSPNPVKKLIRFLIPPAFWLGVWQLTAMAVGMELKLPTPLAVLQALGTLALEPLFWRSAGASLLRIFLGMAAGTLLGVLLACVTSLSRWANAILAPAIKVVRATPVISFILLVWLWVSRSYVPSVISALMVLPVVWLNVSRGIAETDSQLLELARTYRFGTFKTLRLIYIPSVKPYFASGVNTAMGLAWKSGVAAEAICLPAAAIGTQVYYSKLYLESPDLFAWTAVVIVLSFVLEKLISLLLGEGKGGAL